MNLSSNAFRRTAALLTGLWLLSTGPLRGETRCKNPSEQQLFIGEGIAEAATQYGPVRGFLLRGVYSFRGIPYGDDTGGENRFLPPRPPQPWHAVRPAVAYGASSPQPFYDRRPESYSMFVDHWNYDLMDEDCLRLNVWTPGLGDGKRRPVLVWLHGGGFTQGNGIEQDGYDGEHIARYGDIVFCSVNHRLGALGFTDLSAAGEKYRHSGNAGMLDLVAALEWVQHNIAQFGGDPANVTIMGQSGGGSKVCLLCAMPAAEGLFHKAVALSGNSLRANDAEYARRLGAAILDEAGLSAAEADSLQTIPWERYLALADRARQRMAAANPGYRSGFAPVADGEVIPRGTFFKDENRTVGSDVPMLLSSTFHEWNPDRDDPELEEITLEEVVQRLAPQYGPRAERIVAAYAAAFPALRPIEIWALIASNRQGVVQTADAKCCQRSPVYMAWFGWQSPLFNGRHRAFHCLDISFWLLNTDRMVTHTGGGREPRRLSRRMADALLHFMRTGDPNCGALPRWPRYTPERGETMIFDTRCRAAEDPDRTARRAFHD
ncbi:carboxylesterase/lipase family protein [Alistipes sp.]|uniref:carboxylesterase/lipase family protein n=1 Tax=Alistipes sp. TaxID=1872444 RepID=UPI003AF0E905